MFIQNLNNTPRRVSNERAAIEAINIINLSGEALFIKIYQSEETPTASDIPSFCWPSASGEDRDRLVAKNFVYPVWIAASATEGTDGAGLDAVGAGVNVNISEGSRQD